jgi:hypothetical protein
MEGVSGDENNACGSSESENMDKSKDQAGARAEAERIEWKAGGRDARIIFPGSPRGPRFP